MSSVRIVVKRVAWLGLLAIALTSCSSSSSVRGDSRNSERKSRELSERPGHTSAAAKAKTKEAKRKQRMAAEKAEKKARAEARDAEKKARAEGKRAAWEEHGPESGDEAERHGARKDGHPTKGDAKADAKADGRAKSDKHGHGDDQARGHHGASRGDRDDDGDGRTHDGKDQKQGASKKPKDELRAEVGIEDDRAHGNDAGGSDKDKPGKSGKK
jgi:hypothetical protein